MHIYFDTWMVLLCRDRRSFLVNYSKDVKIILVKSSPGRMLRRGSDNLSTSTPLVADEGETPPNLLDGFEGDRSSEIHPLEKAVALVHKNGLTRHSQGARELVDG